MKEADLCLIVAEPTRFGAHNFEMVLELVQVLGKRCAVIVNKASDDNALIDDLCAERGLPVLGAYPLQCRDGARWALSDASLWKRSRRWAEVFSGLWRAILKGGAGT